MNARDIYNEAAAAFQARSIDHPDPIKQDEYGTYHEGKLCYNPFFCLTRRDGKIACVWCGNRKKDKYKKRPGSNERVLASKGEPEIYRVSDSKIRAGFEPDEWDKIVRAILSKTAEATK
ncbi:hypothetical protein KAR91_57505 [Candidatus Pacearchaeota archaeon]|nr:hypothetical protein [Candidatus Pacearchaeota archaeon]